MPYVGNQIRQLSDRVVLDSISVTATDTFDLQLNSVDFVPSSAESLTVSLNGIIQAPISSYTVSSNQIIFDSALTTSDTIDFIIAERGITLQTPSAGSVNTTQLASSAVTNAKIATPLTLGKIGQIKQTVKKDSFTTTSTSFVDVTGFSVSITPSSTSSKILVMVSIGVLANSGAGGTAVNIKRGTTTIVSNTDGGSADTTDSWVLSGGQTYTNNNRFNRPGVLVYLDSPASTSAQTYKCQMLVGSGTGYFNRWGTNTDQAGVSTITVQEILG